MIYVSRWMDIKCINKTNELIKFNSTMFYHIIMIKNTKNNYQIRIREISECLILSG